MVLTLAESPAQGFITTIEEAVEVFKTGDRESRVNLIKALQELLDVDPHAVVNLLIASLIYNAEFQLAVIAAVDKISNKESF